MRLAPVEALSHSSVARTVQNLYSGSTLRGHFYQHNFAALFPSLLVLILHDLVFMTFKSRSCFNKSQMNAFRTASTLPGRRLTAAPGTHDSVPFPFSYHAFEYKSLLP